MIKLIDKYLIIDHFEHFLISFVLHESRVNSIVEIIEDRFTSVQQWLYKMCQLYAYGPPALPSANTLEVTSLTDYWVI